MVTNNTKGVIVSKTLTYEFVKEFIENHTLADFINMPSFDYEEGMQFY